MDGAKTGIGKKEGSRNNNFNQPGFKFKGVPEKNISFVNTQTGVQFEISRYWRPINQARGEIKTREMRGMRETGELRDWESKAMSRRE